MGRLYLGIDCGTQSTKGVVIDEEKNITATAAAANGADTATACKQVLTELAAAAGPEITAAGITGANKPLPAELFPIVRTANDMTAQAAGTAAACPEAKTAVVLGGRLALLLRIADGTLDSYELGTVFDKDTGLFLDQKAAELGIAIEDYAGIAQTGTKPALLPARGAMPTADDFHRMGYTDGDILMGYCKAVANRYVKNITKKQPLDGPIVLQGGLAQNAAMIDVMQTKLKTDLIILEHPACIGALGAAVIALESGEEKSVDLNAAAASPVTSKNAVCRNCPNMCTVTGAYKDGELLASWGNKCDRIDPRSIL